MQIFLRYCYVVLSYLLIPLLLLHLFWKGLGNRDYWGRIGERFGWFSQPGLKGVIWVHAVSVGEVQAAASLVNNLLKHYPDKRLVLTTMTPTGSDRVRLLFGNQVTHCYAPFDLAWSVRRFFNWCRPQIVIILETELWPNLYHECGEREVPLVLASARVSPKSIGRYRWLVSLFKKALSHGIVIAAQTPADAERFVSIGANPERTHVTGNIKFDFEFPKGVLEQGSKFRQAYMPGRPVWIAASTHANEEEIVLEAHKQVRNKFPDALLILVPRHPERFAGVAALLNKQKISFVRRSSGSTLEADNIVLLVDTMGELMSFYAAADVAFVAGSLTPDVGGHNLLEPAALQLPMITGPYNYNSQDIADLFHTNGLSAVVTDAESLADTVSALLADPDESKRQGVVAEALIKNSRGALDRLLKLLDPLIT
ncbi:MAG: 3-deoxy-D-manno-octulosonic acid transferase [Gammaproteobacteria bacterium]|nr:3-deoxy-D-manno-octulosonic acid transferase [Gammaproteobacteria bacterium]